MILILAIFNDGTIITIANDRVKPSPKPTKWRLKRIFISAIVYGIYLAASTLVFFAIATQTNFLQNSFGIGPIQPSDFDTPTASYYHSIVYLQVSIISQALIFTTRSQGFFFTERPTILLVIAFIIAQWAIVWVYDIIWFLPLDFVTFGLQIAFARSPTAVKPFNQCCECCFSKICKGNAIAPENVTTIQITSHNPPVHQLSKINNDVATQIQSHMQEKSITTINEIAEFDAPYYKPHTDILSGLKQQVFMAGSFSQ
ncbi:unnamed protein product [Rotaria magnacalcarata]|uniref:Uncharacterized protein n=1 Tax=Rotaria magnacalcarata TaxID=392030 RepID=A0A815E3K2_9BILA|nr:unnamed protein product [Rotaria magnacalcarata]CAF1311859.1 unnamed protein product [Rotaria magnacalcarata]CAF4345635.1 unnamed protein product [Rotaria magnacalcarata]CAF4383179.1 unnamed protein product [Rotaria magnacalcarata]